MNETCVMNPKSSWIHWNPWFLGSPILRRQPEIHVSCCLASKIWWSLQHWVVYAQMDLNSLTTVRDLITRIRCEPYNEERQVKGEREREGKNTHGNYVYIYNYYIYIVCTYNENPHIQGAKIAKKKSNHPAKYKHQAHIYFDCPNLAIKWYQVRTN